jgi:hypothetical protein
VIDNNLVYGNVSTGISLTSGSVISIVNNTVYQSVGQALTLAGVSTVTVENNILWVDEGDIIGVASGAQTGFVSAYNLFYQGANATPAAIGIFQGTTAATLAAWQTASGQDTAGSKTGNPDFVNIAGADQVLGGPGTPIGAGADDDFELKAGSPAIDAANAYVAPFNDLLGQPRHDDPATTNTGIGYPLFVQSDAGASSFPAATSETSLNLQSNGAVATYTLPFSFTLYGTAYSSVTVSSQGYLQFAGADTYGYDTPSLANFANAVRIAPLWAQFNTYAASGDGVFVSSTATSVTFRWQGSSDNGGGAVNVAVTLNKDGSFVFNYGSGNAGLSPIIGVSSGNSQVYVLSSTSGSAALGGIDAQRFTPTPGDAYFDIGAFEFQGSSADHTPPTVVSISSLPAPGGTTGLAFTSLTVQFSEPLDLVSARSPANYSLIKADVNGQFNTTGATVIPLLPQYVLGTGSVTLQLPDGYLAPGLYQLTLSGTRAIFDQSGNPLAGNGSTAGTDYVTTFTINRTADQPPVAIAQSVTLLEAASAQIVLTATDAAGFPLVYSITAPPADGSLSAITNGNTLSYTPAPGYYGNDSFTFQATDPDGGESTAVVALTVTPVNQPPVAIAQSVTAIHDKAQLIILGGSDAETPASQLIYTITTQPAHGTLTQSLTNPDAFTYTPAAGYVGADSFAFTVTDTGNPPGNLANQKTSAPALVSFAVTDPAPVGVAASYTTRERVPLNVTTAQGVLAHDTDSAGDPLTATLATTVSHGTLVFNANGSFIYTPNPTFVGTDSFTYIPHGTYSAGSATTVTITVLGAVGAPSAPAAPTPPAPPAPVNLAPPAPALPSVLTTPAMPITVASLAVVGIATPSFAGMMAVDDPITLPDTTPPPDDDTTLMLPAMADVSSLSEAFAAALRRLGSLPPSLITFIDPDSGAPDGEDAGAAGAAPDWVFIDGPIDTAQTGISRDA